MTVATTPQIVPAQPVSSDSRQTRLASLACEPAHPGDHVMDFALVSHELRTPLHVMLVHLRLLAPEDLSADGRGHLTVLESQVRRMMRLLDSGATPAHDEIVRSQVDVGVTIRNVVSELASLFDRRGIAIAWTRDRPVPCVDGDPDLLHRALLNLLLNAADAMRDS